jgi:hypothetical protein
MLNAPSDLEARVEAAENTMKTLLKQVRGTRPGAPSTARPPPNLAERIESALRAAPLSIGDLAAQLREPAGRVAAAIKPLRKRLWNAGTDVSPRWFVPPDDDASPEVFTLAVQALIRAQPYSTSELQAATRTAGSKKVWHAIVRLNDAPDSRLVRHGDARRPRWWWVPEGLDLSRFAADGRSGNGVRKRT